VHVLAAVSAVAATTGCGGGGADAREPAPSASAVLSVTSPAFRDGGAVPRRFTCRGADLSPPLRWSGVPPEATATALVMSDPDAPGGTYVHWVLLDLDPGVTSLPAGETPAGAHQAVNTAGHARYDGPCPPSGTHHYRFTVYALRAGTGLPDGADLDEALDAVDRTAIARGTLTGTVSP
jgi:hypothetical protein